MVKSFKTNEEASYETQMDILLGEIYDKTGSLSTMVNNFAKYCRRQEVTRFIARYEMFRRIQNIRGSIVECGVYSGQGLMTWAQLSSILEPIGGMLRHIYGFDTFEGFPSIHDKDLQSREKLDWKKGDLRSDSYEELEHLIKLYDKNRFLGQIPKVTLIKGDFMKTAAVFLEENQHVMISLLYLDFDLYEPTHKALEVFLPRMAKGSIIGFDELNNPVWPGETRALFESLDIRTKKIEVFPFEPNMSFMVLD